MKNRRLESFGTMFLLAALLSIGCSPAYAAGRGADPELAAKMEIVRNQREQRVTTAKRKAAAQALKAERIKLYQARQAAHRTTQATTDVK